MGFNSAFKGLNTTTCKHYDVSIKTVISPVLR